MLYVGLDVHSKRSSICILNNEAPRRMTRCDRGQLLLDSLDLLAPVVGA